MEDGLKVLAAVVVVIFVTLLVVDVFNPAFGFFAKVESGYVGIQTRFGKIEDKVLPAGFHITGWFTQVHPVNIRTQIVKGELVAFSSDIQQVTLNLAINYNITPEIANQLYRTVGTDYGNTIMAPRVNENAKAVVSNYNAESLIANREKLSGEILALLQRDLESYGITVSAVSVENLDFTDAFEAAVEAKQVATQDAQRAKTMQEQQTMEARQEADRKKIAAEAAADAVRQQADAEAYETRVKAEAQAEANKLVAETVTDMLINYEQAKQWNGQLPNFYGGNGVLPIIDGTMKEAKLE